MFINCPYCRALVATDLATDLPPPLCPQCKGPLREQEPQAANADAEEISRTSAASTTTIDDALRDTPSDAIDDPTPDTEDDENNEYSSMLDELAPVPPEAALSKENADSIDAMYDLANETTIDTANDPNNDATSDATDGDGADGLPASADDGRIDEHVDEHVDEHAGEYVDDLDASGETLETIATTETAVEAPAAPSSIPRTTNRRRAGQTAPSFARAATRDDTTAARGRRWPAILAIAALSATLVLQMLLADRARLATSARWRPLLETLCGALSCDLPPWREPEAFALLQRDVRQHPTLRGALRVTASFRNDARWPQPWPKLHVTLSDVNGRPAGERSFEAREYLGGPPAQTMLGSGETATVAMDVLEPAAQTVAYDMRFR
ncbi:MAG: DUF3426 domain-containing protein [Xanthomonadaceae bacterium]|nr:DUF3426 domain-containing protein [Xanthomonadaceae bacterium]